MNLRPLARGDADALRRGSRSTPATENVAAIRAYEKAGFEPVGVMRRSERDADGSGWHDSLLMELVVDGC